MRFLGKNGNNNRYGLWSCCAHSIELEKALLKLGPYLKSNKTCFLGILRMKWTERCEALTMPAPGGSQSTLEPLLHPLLPLALRNRAGHCYSQVTGDEMWTPERYCDHPWSLGWWSRSGFLISLSFKLQMALPRIAALWQRTKKVIFDAGILNNWV